MKVFDLKKELTSTLTPVFGAREASAMVRDILEDVVGITPVDSAVHPDRQLLDVTVNRMRDIVTRVIEGEPLQYVLGVAHFMGMTLKVSSDVLIPRPETAQLVDIITDKYASTHDLRVLDIGTGSGCIAIALSRALPFAHVKAMDVSQPALAIARSNASDLHCKIEFILADILSVKPTPDSYDIIVSNPPYIAEFERKEMEPMVYENEPATALFVPDTDPLLFYRAIADYAQVALNNDGRLYFEINPLFVDDLVNMLMGKGWQVDIERDFCNKKRFAICHR